LALVSDPTAKKYSLDTLLNHRNMKCSVLHNAPSRDLPSKTRYRPIPRRADREVGRHSSARSTCRRNHAFGFPRYPRRRRTNCPIRPIGHWRARASVSSLSLPRPVSRQNACISPAGLFGLASNPGDHMTGGSSSVRKGRFFSLGRGLAGLRRRIPRVPTGPL